MPDGQTILQRIATKAVIVNDKGQVLILREARTYGDGTNRGKYQLPGGRLNPGEALLDGLEREVYEESGLKVGIGLPIYAGEWRPVIKGIQNQIIGIFFVCKPLTETVRLSEEHDDYQWVLPSEISQYELTSPEEKVFEAYTASLAS